MRPDGGVADINVNTVWHPSSDARGGSLRVSTPVTSATRNTCIS
ncbi:hypothetical protein ACX122_21880 [Kosakonia cowanii]|nr:hypothetical protein [Kosakonia sp. HypNH10]MDH2913848.1 hypothetical protein [Kosakonia sp. HypNH10]